MLDAAILAPDARKRVLGAPCLAMSALGMVSVWQNRFD